MVVFCPWCEKVIAGRPKECPECGLSLEGLPASSGNTAGVPSGVPPLRLNMVGLVLALLAALPTGFLVASEAKDIALFFAGQRYAEPFKERVWQAGKAAIRARLNRSNYDEFQRSSVVVSAGNLASFCGWFEIPEQEGVFVKRFVALDGRRDSAVMEYQTVSFDVLWNRLCVADRPATAPNPPSNERTCAPPRMVWLQGPAPKQSCSVTGTD